MATPFEEFVNRELPRRPALLTVAITSYDGDPNDIGAPSILQGAPIGTYYLRETPVTLYQKLVPGSFTWSESGSGGGDSDLFTSEDLTASVDYNDVNAVDPPSGMVFSRQAEIDSWLLSQGATNFKHAEAFYNALPQFVLHTVTINLAAGIHRPWPLSPSTTTAFSFSRKYIYGSLDIAGSLPSTWTVISGLSGLVPTAYQSANRDPWVDFAGAPFTGLDLRGYYVVFSTGQTALIHDHTNSRLYVTSVISPTPIGGTCFVAQQATLLRNSLDDVNVYKSSTFTTGSMAIGSRAATTSFYVLARNIVVDPFGNTSTAVSMSALAARLEYLTVDHEISRNPPFSKTPNGNSITGSGSGIGSFTCYLVSIRERNTGTAGVDCAFLFSNCLTAFFYGCYAEGCEDGCEASSVISNVAFYSSVFNGVGKISSVASFWFYGGIRSIDFYDLGTSGTLGMGKDVEFRNGRSGVPVLRFDSDCRLRSQVSRFRFVNNQGSLIVVDSKATVETVNSTYGPMDGGGNTGIGVDFVGSGGSVRLPTGSTLAASGGAVRMKDGTILATLADVKALGPVVDGSFNFVEKL